ncbi:MAG: glycosyltransferase family 4 protein [Methanococcoides sp.]|nr:glycosyltransferase family 4 protein [Methanococcoides sp.]
MLKHNNNNDNLKIFVVDRIEPPQDGTIFLNPLWEILKELSGMGCDIHTISSKNDSWQNVHFHRMRLSNKWPIFLQGIAYIYSIFGAILIAKKNKFDLVYFRSVHGRPIALLLKYVLNLNYVCEIHGVEFFENEYSAENTNSFKKIFLKVKAYSQIFSAKNADGIRAVTDELKQYLIAQGIDGSKIDVIENGVNTNVFRPFETSTDVVNYKYKKGIKESSNVIVWEGYCYPWQGVEFLIKASSLILERFPNTVFLIVGDGEMLSSWKKLVHDLNLESEFVFTASVPYDEVCSYINIADVCVCPEINDERNDVTGGSSLKLFEYLACNKPVVIGNLKGNMKIVSQSGTGLIVDAQNTVELSDAIVKLLGDKNNSVEMGIRGRDFILKKYSWSKLSQDVFYLCKRCVN